MRDSEIGKIITALECCVMKDKNGASLCEECPYGEKGACAYLAKLNRYKQIAQKAYFSGEKLTSVEAVIASLYDQARDKDRLADDDEVSIFAEDARFLREAAVLLEAQNMMEAQKWQTSDRRPPHKGYYLVYGVTDIVPDHIDQPNAYWEIKIGYWDCKRGWSFGTRKVKYWRELPALPEELRKAAKQHDT